MPVIFPLPRPPTPSWVAAICRDRSFFDESIIERRLLDGSCRAWQMSFCKQRPFTIVFVDVRVSESVHAGPLAERAQSRSRGDRHVHNFQAPLDSYCTHCDIGDIPGATYFVLPSCINGAHYFVGSDDDWHALNDLLEARAVSRAPPPPEEAPVGTVVDDEPERAWLVKALAKLDNAKRRRRLQLEPEAEAVEPAADEDVRGLWDVVGADRAYIEGDVAGAPHRKFVVGPRVSESNLNRHSGALTDSYRAEPRGRSANKWIRLFNVRPMSATFTIAYERDVCLILCRAWASRMQHFFDLRVIDGSRGDFIYTADMPC